MPDAAEVLRAPAHEARDVTVRLLVFGAAGLLCVVVALAVLAAVLYPGSATIGVGPREIATPAQPALQASPRADMQALRREQRAWLDGAGWVDRPRGVVHIPIERAMRDVAARGWGR